jgi:hypothetical protein
MRAKRQRRLQHRIRVKQLYYCVIYLFMVSLVVTGVSFSRFSTTLTNTGAENIDVPNPGTTPDIEFSTWALDYEAATFYFNNLAPGDMKNVTIWVSNKNSSGTVSGYNQNVTLELKTTANLPLVFTLKKDGSPVLFNHPDNYRYVSETQSFTANVEEIKEYVLTVSWPEGENHYRYNNEIDYIELKLTAVQA